MTGPVVSALESEMVMPNPVDCCSCSSCRKSQQVDHGEPWLLSKEQEVGSEAGRCKRRVVVRLAQLPKTDGSPGFLFWKQGTQQTVHRAGYRTAETTHGPGLFSSWWVLPA